jgi:hypothetical protein
VCLRFATSLVGSRAALLKYVLFIVVRPKLLHQVSSPELDVVFYFRQSTDKLQKCDETSMLTLCRRSESSFVSHAVMFAFISTPYINRVCSNNVVCCGILDPADVLATAVSSPRVPRRLFRTGQEIGRTLRRTCWSRKSNMRTLNQAAVFRRITEMIRGFSFVVQLRFTRRLLFLEMLLCAAPCVAWQMARLLRPADCSLVWLDDCVWPGARAHDRACQT